MAELVAALPRIIIDLLIFTLIHAAIMDASEKRSSGQKLGKEYF